MILYDSQYAYGVTRLFNPDTNLGLATTVASLVDAARSKMKLDFTHVRSLRGIHGNEIADRLAKRGANNPLTPLHGDVALRQPCTYVRSAKKTSFGGPSSYRYL